MRESGTLTEHELSDAMRSIMGATPKVAETSRVLRFFGEPGAAGEGVSEWRILLERKRREGDGETVRKGNMEWLPGDVAVPWFWRPLHS